MNKTLLIPLIIIIGGIMIGGYLWFGGGLQDFGSSQNTLAGDGYRKLELEIKNMFCVGCRSSVVNSLMALPGVAQADADPRTDSGWVVYDPKQISKEQIVAAPIFQAYPAAIQDDQKYAGTVGESGTREIPAELEFKLNILAQGLEERGVSLEPFIEEELNEAIEQGYWEKAENIVDNSLEAIKQTNE